MLNLPVLYIYAEQWNCLRRTSKTAIAWDSYKKNANLKSSRDIRLTFVSLSIVAVNALSNSSMYSATSWRML
jgi:hypothetical protein